ncbi:MAG: hypothetical protein HZB33_15400 [Nitrospirae bacterium]|nr:hypothetical protein [Nitrospirota bacterium]
MEKYSIREAVEQAVRTERLGFDFYTAASSKFGDNKPLQDLFGTLAAKELEHEKKFSDLRDSLRDEEPAGWEEVSEYLRAIVQSEFFLGKNKSLASLEAVRTVEEAVDYAVGFEKETLLYFYAVRDVIGEQKVIDVIIEEEKSHILMLGKFAMGLAGL